MNIVKPKKLKKGDCIGIIAPCGLFKSHARLDKAVEFFKKEGFRVKVSKHLFDQDRYLAGTDEIRAKEIEEFFIDEDVDAIICARGGYGAIRIIDKLDYSMIRANMKPFCGFSDVTALSTMLLKRAGLVTFSAPMINGDFGNDISDFTWKSFKTALMKNQIITYESDGKIYKDGDGVGISFGGNLATLVSLCGTDFLPNEGFILFIEDLNEPAYKIDRMLSQLLNIEKFRRYLRGVVLGEFTNDENPEFLDRVFEDFAKRVEVPVISGFKITHSKDKITVPIGVPAQIKDGKFILA